MHTNFDTGYRGMNDALAQKMGLINIKPLEFCSMARGGELVEEMEIHDFVKKFNKIMGLDYSLLVHAGKERIKTVAIVGGGGSPVVGLGAGVGGEMEHGVDGEGKGGIVGVDDESNSVAP